MNCAVFGYVEQSMSQPCPAWLLAKVSKKKLLGKICQQILSERLKLLTNLILQKCSLQEEVHKRGHIIFKEKKNCVNKCLLQGKALRGVGFKALMYSWKQWWKCSSWKRKRDSTKAVGEVVGTSKIVEGWEAKLGYLPKKGLVEVQASLFTLTLQTLFETQKSLSKLGKTTMC